MQMTSQNFLVFLACAVLAVALRSFVHPLPRKLGAVMVLVASYLPGLLFLGSHLAGLAGALAWFFLPWVELLTRIRRLRLPIRKTLRHVPPPSAQRFPELREMTDEIEQEGFEHVDDLGWKWEGMSQFYRLFQHPQTRMEATISLSEQGPVALAYLSLTTRESDGTVWRTWNFPFSETMAPTPRLRLQSLPGAGSLAELIDAHEQWLLCNGLDPVTQPEIAPEEIASLMEQEIGEQIAHNLARGLIAAASGETFRYSWRGLLFLWAQFVKDMVRLS
jgi:hypothetical protein